MMQPKKLRAVESENRRLLLALLRSRTRHGGDVDTPEQLVENGSPDEVEAYIGGTRKFRDALISLALVVIGVAIAAYATDL